MKIPFQLFLLFLVCFQSTVKPLYGDAGEQAGAGGEAFFEDSLQSLTAVAEAYDIERGPFDVLYLEEGNVIPGTLSGGTFEIESRFGREAIDFNEIGALTGGFGQGRPVCVYLRNGEILAGSANTEMITLLLRGGGKLPVAVAGLKALVMRVNERDGMTPKGSGCYMTTSCGERLLLADAEKIPLPVYTPWGELTIDFMKGDRLTVSSRRQRKNRMALRNGMRLSVFFSAPVIQLETLRFGDVDFKTAEITSLAWIHREKGPFAGASGDADDSPAFRLNEAIKKKLGQETFNLAYKALSLEELVDELNGIPGVAVDYAPDFPDAKKEEALTIVLVDAPFERVINELLAVAGLKAEGAGDTVVLSVPAKEDMPSEEKATAGNGPAGGNAISVQCKLVGENVLLGTLGLSSLHVRIESRSVPVALPQLVEIKRLEEKSGDGALMFEVSLTDGRVLTGPIEEPIMPICLGDDNLLVPISHLTGCVVPERSSAGSAEKPSAGSTESP